MLDPYSEWILWLYYAVGGILYRHGLSPFVALAGGVMANQCKVALSDHFYPLIKHFYAHGNALFHDDNGSEALRVFHLICHQYVFKLFG